MDRDFIISIASTGLTLIVLIIFGILRMYEYKKAKTREEKDKVLKNIEGDLLGFISMAEATFSDVPKSGPSKLVYVLNKVKQACSENSVDFEEEKWTEEINKVVEQTNKVIDERNSEIAHAQLLEEIKGDVMKYVDNARSLFAHVPEPLEYQLAYVLKYTEQLCLELHVAFDDNYWDATIREILEGKQ